MLMTARVLLLIVLTTISAVAVAAALAAARHGSQRSPASPRTHRGQAAARVYLDHDHTDPDTRVHVVRRAWGLDLAEDAHDASTWSRFQPLLTPKRGDGDDDKDLDPLPHPHPHPQPQPHPHPRPNPISPPPPHDDPLPPTPAPAPYDPLPKHPPKAPIHHDDPGHPAAPDPDPFPRYNLLLSSASRSLFLPPVIFLLLWGLHAVALWAGAAYHDRRRLLLTAHPEARYPPGFGPSRARAVSSASSDHEYGTSGATTGPATASGGMARAAEPDLTRREDAERVVAGLVQEVRQTRTVSRPVDTRTSESTTPNLGQRIESATGVHMPSESDPLLGPTREAPAPHMGIPHSLLDTPHDQLDPGLTDPILTLFSEPDADWLADTDTYERRALIIQPSGITAVKNAGQVAGMLFTMTLALAVMGTLGALGMPQPTARDDAVGSRMRVLTLVGTSWALVGVGLLWVLGEGTFLAVHDLHRLRSVATLILFVLMLVYGVALEVENRARLHEMERTHRPGAPSPSLGFPSPDMPNAPDALRPTPSALGMAAVALNTPALVGWF